MKNTKDKRKTLKKKMMRNMTAFNAEKSRKKKKTLKVKKTTNE